MQAFVKDDKLIINTQILPGEKEKFVEFIEKAETNDVSATTLYDINGDKAGIEIDLGQKETLEINPSKEEQIFEGKFKSVQVNPIPDGQDKEIEITHNNTSMQITADEDYFGLNSVNITTNIPGNFNFKVTGLPASPPRIAAYLESIDIDCSKFANTSVYSSLFQDCYTLKTVNLTNIPNNITRTEYMFRECKNIQEGPYFDTSNVSHAAYMFYNCVNLTSIPEYNFSNIQYARDLFYNCGKLTSVSNLYFGNVIQADEMFKSCSNLTSASNLTFNCNMSVYGPVSYMFDRCYKLTSVDNLTINAKETGYIFINCSNLRTVTNLKINHTESTSRMFFMCYNLLEAPEINTSACTGMSEMFFCCYNLRHVPYYDTSNCTSMGEMFRGCRNLVDVPQYNTSKVTSLYMTFCECNNLSDAAIQNVINMCLNSNVTNTARMNIQQNVFTSSNISNRRYENRWEELTAAGWSY